MRLWGCAVWGWYAVHAGWKQRSELPSMLVMPLFRFHKSCCNPLDQSAGCTTRHTTPHLSLRYLINSSCLTSPFQKYWTVSHRFFELVSSFSSSCCCKIKFESSSTFSWWRPKCHRFFKAFPPQRLSETPLSFTWLRNYCDVQYADFSHSIPAALGLHQHAWTSKMVRFLTVQCWSPACLHGCGKSPVLLTLFSHLN